MRATSLRMDLRALGLGEDRIRAIASCAPAASLGDDPDAALGSVCVLGGSTLGGRVITRHLRQAPWCPPEGSRYFDPYGDDTGSHCRHTLAQLAITRGDPDRIVAGAVRTFELLQRWLVPPSDDRPMRAAMCVTN